MVLLYTVCFDFKLVSARFEPLRIHMPVHSNLYQNLNAWVSENSVIKILQNTCLNAFFSTAFTESRSKSSNSFWLRMCYVCYNYFHIYIHMFMGAAVFSRATLRTWWYMLRQCGVYGQVRVSTSGAASHHLSHTFTGWGRRSFGKFDSIISFHLNRASGTQTANVVFIANHFGRQAKRNGYYSN